VRRLLAIKWRLLPLAIAAAVLCIPAIESALSHHQVSQAAQAAQTQLDQSHNKAAAIRGQPIRILVPGLSIDLPVVPQSYSMVTKTWPVAPNVANYATDTAAANNTKGETLIYGHDTRNVFGPLQDLKPNDLVYVYTENGHIFKYSYIGAQDITPAKVSIIDDMAKAPAGLKLITCSGPNFEYRHLMSFKLAQYS
jgi:LPXTG-site transpeptidase (sortase) family protein